MIVLIGTFGRTRDSHDGRWMAAQCFYQGGLPEWARTILFGYDTGLLQPLTWGGGMVGF